MNKRFRNDCDNFEDVTEYFRKRALQLLKYDIFLESINELPYGAFAVFKDIDGNQLHSLYIYHQYWGQNYYAQFMKQQQNPTILTSDDCGIEEFLKHRGYNYIAIPLYGESYYRVISDYYGTRIAIRSGLEYMNHIDEGLAIMRWMKIDDKDALGAYAVHPIFQSDNDLVNSVSRYNLETPNNSIADIDKMMILYAMEYRSFANEYLSKRQIDSIDEIRVSPLRQVNWMLMADKIQNRKDFELYHEGAHSRSNELSQYFKNWLERLEIPEERYQQIKSKLIINPNIYRISL